MTRLRQYAAGVTFGMMAMLGGCADRPMSIPSSATLMTEGNGDRISYRASEFGRVYVSDQTNNQILYQGEVHRGDAIEVNPRADRVMVGGRTVLEKPLDDGHQFKIFFEPMPEERVVKYRVVEEREVRP